ncbi:MAG: hypothetical protein ACTSSF_12190, partial [Candidatus Heimdallarchaeaceae archaeon]
DGFFFSFFEILLSLFSPLHSMFKVFRGYALVFFLLLLSLSYSVVSAYDDIYGIEYNDHVQISFTRYIDGKFSLEYSEDSPLEVIVNYNEINIHVVNALLGMKIGEVKDIEWDVEQDNGTVNHFEYRNTKVLKITRDATPEKKGIGDIILTIFEVLLGLALTAGAVFAFIKIRKRLLRKTCVGCGGVATSKCSKCGNFVCENCTIKNCPVCGSRKFIRLQ